jgi:hypothetical protein
MSGGTDGKEFGDSFNDPQDGGEQVVVQTKVILAGWSVHKSFALTVSGADTRILAEPLPPTGYRVD